MKVEFFQTKKHSSGLQVELGKEATIINQNPRNQISPRRLPVRFSLILCTKLLNLIDLG